jgi:hypothetical protein
MFMESLATMDIYAHDGGWGCILNLAFIRLSSRSETSMEKAEKHLSLVRQCVIVDIANKPHVAKLHSAIDKPCQSAPGGVMSACRQ